MILVVLIFIAILLLVVWVLSKAPEMEKEMPPAPLPEPKSFTPLADTLGKLDKFEDKQALQPPRELPHVTKRKGKK